MIFRNVIFLFGLLVAVGCGVMSNPSKDSETKISRVNLERMVVSDANRVFIDSIGDMNTTEDNAYKIFETKIFMEEFLKDINTTAQVLAEGDFETVKGWINSMRSANTDFQAKNILFYPILEPQDCGIQDSVTIDINNTANIVLQPTRNMCEEAFIYHVLVYQVSKKIENISIKAFDKKSITIPNHAK